MKGPMKLHWDGLDSQSKEEILGNACVNSRHVHYEWMEMDYWLRDIIRENMEKRSHGNVTLAA